jgi:asparagine synthase (glutamine-hydrolysing)
MCGIAVHFRLSGDASRLNLERLTHRGPDASGEWQSRDGRCWLGATRLAVLDLSPTGAQPMTDPATGNVIVANGEIYNHRALRKELGPTVNWQGTGDTETLLQAYGQWRFGMLDRVKGMFAFAIYDANRKELFLARDRFGIKPLYYVIEGDSLRIGSEIKVLDLDAAAMTPASVSAYLQSGASPERELLYREIKVVPAGRAMTIGEEGSPKIWRYWPSRPALVSSTESVTQKVRRLIETAVNEHLLSDVPVASFLSGGVDSSIVTAIAAQRLEKGLQTFSVGFDLAEFDETAIAREVAERYRTDHHMDLPSVDAINTYIVAKAVAARGVKVALSGLGGDELFGGYSSFQDIPKLKMVSKLPRCLRSLLGRIGGFGDRLADLPGNSSAGELAQWRRRFFTDEVLQRAGLPQRKQSVDCPIDLPDDFARISWAELTGYMRHLLLRDADQMSMAVSLELRVPFLDHGLVEYVLGLPEVEKKRYPGSKGLLVEACRDLLPPSVYRRHKSGFTLPMKSWMLGPLDDFVSEGLEEVVAQEILSPKFVTELQQAFQADRLHWTRLWSIVVLGHFARRSARANCPDENIAVHSFA